MTKKSTPSTPPPADSSIVPDPTDSHPIVRVSKWVGIFVGIGGGLALLVTGIWKVGDLLNDLEQVQTDVAALRSSVTEASAEARRRSDIQEEILLNLRIAVASLQARSGTPRGGSAPSSTPPVTRPRVPVARVRPHPVADTPPSPEVAALVLSLPPLPMAPPDPPVAPPQPLVAVAPPHVVSLAELPTIVREGRSLDATAYAREVETTDVALERANILLDAL
jgi:hypothetical protein